MSRSKYLLHFKKVKGGTKTNSGWEVLLSFVQKFKNKDSREEPTRAWARRPAARAREEQRDKPRAIRAYGPQSCWARLGFRAAARSAFQGGAGRRSKRDGPRCCNTRPPFVFFAYLRVRLAQQALRGFLPFSVPVSIGRTSIIRNHFPGHKKTARIAPGRSQGRGCYFFSAWALAKSPAFMKVMREGSMRFRSTERICSLVRAITLASRSAS